MRLPAKTITPETCYQEHNPDAPVCRLPDCIGGPHCGRAMQKFHQEMLTNALLEEEEGSFFTAEGDFVDAEEARMYER